MTHTEQPSYLATHEGVGLRSLQTMTPYNHPAPSPQVSECAANPQIRKKPQRLQGGVAENEKENTERGRGQRLPGGIFYLFSPWTAMAKKTKKTAAMGGWGRMGTQETFRSHPTFSKRH